MKSIIYIITTELLGKTIHSYENNSTGVLKMKCTIDKILELNNGYLHCEITIYEKDGTIKHNMYNNFNIDNWNYDILN